MNSQARRCFDNVPRRFGSRAVTGGARQSARSGPSPVSIRDDGNVQTGIDRYLRSCRHDVLRGQMLHVFCYFLRRRKKVINYSVSQSYCAKNFADLSPRASRESALPCGSGSAPAHAGPMPSACTPFWAAVHQRISCKRCNPLLRVCERGRSDCRPSS